MSAAGDRKQREEARAWIAAADEDAGSARVLIAAVPPRLTTAAYLCQQAAEKLMKGLLTVAAVPFRKTHNLGELAGQVADAFPDLAGLVAPLRGLTSWSFAFRYPGAAGLGEPVPTRDELEAVLGAIDELKAELAARAA